MALGVGFQQAHRLLSCPFTRDPAIKPKTGALDKWNKQLSEHNFKKLQRLVLWGRRGICIFSGEWGHASPRRPPYRQAQSPLPPPPAEPWLSACCTPRESPRLPFGHVVLTLVQETGDRRLILPLTSFQNHHLLSSSRSDQLILFVVMNSQI